MGPSFVFPAPLVSGLVHIADCHVQVSKPAPMRRLHAAPRIICAFVSWHKDVSGLDWLTSWLTVSVVALIVVCHAYNNELNGVETVKFDISRSGLDAAEGALSVQSRGGGIVSSLYSQLSFASLHWSI